MHLVRPQKKRYGWLSIPVTLGAVLLAHWLQIPNPMLILIIPIVFFCYVDGYIGGLISALISICYTFYIVSGPGGPDFQNLLISFMAPMLVVFLVGKLKADSRSAAEAQKQSFRQMSRINAELNQTATEARTANKAKSLFISSVSHDIRTPINIILGLTNLAMDEIEDKRAVKDYLTKINSSGQHLLDLINNVLDISKIESGEFEFNLESYRLEDFVEEISLMFKPLCDHQEVHLAITLENDNVPAVVVDRVRFKQVFFNLLSNAVKFTPKGGTVTLEIAAGKVNRRAHCTFKVKDSGIGMSQEFQEKMFEAYTREQKADSAQIQGTGLGLRIVKSIVDIFDGTITVESQEKKGTTFIVELELALGEAEEATGPETGGSDLEAINLAGLNILLAEDNPLNSKITSRLLMKKGVVVTCAENGQIAVETFKNSPEGFFDAVLMDIQMPLMDGLEAASHIRSFSRSDAQVVPIIAMTANAFGEDVEKSLQSGMNKHLTKPTTPANLYATLASLVK